MPLPCSAAAPVTALLNAASAPFPHPHPPPRFHTPGTFLTPDEELLLDASSLHVGIAGMPLAQLRPRALVSNTPPDVAAVLAAAHRAGIALEPDTGAVPSATLAALAAKPRAPPNEWVMAPPLADPFSVKEDEEGEEA